MPIAQYLTVLRQHITTFGSIVVAKHDDPSPNHLTIWIAVHIRFALRK